MQFPNLLSLPEGTLRAIVLMLSVTSATLSGDVAAGVSYEQELSMDQLEQFKELLSDPKQRIKLHDFVADRTKNLVAEVGQDKLPVQGPSDGNSFIARLQTYEGILQTVLPLQMLLGRWGLPDHTDIAAFPLRRLAGAILATGGSTYLIEARWYPVLLLLYASCIGAISGSNYQVVHKLFHAAMPNQEGRQNRDILLI
jgi:hypothetical protein